MAEAKTNNSKKEEEKESRVDWGGLALQVASTAATGFLTGFTLAAGQRGFERLFVKRATLSQVNDVADVISLSKHG